MMFGHKNSSKLMKKYELYFQIQENLKDIDNEDIKERMAEFNINSLDNYSLKLLREIEDLTEGIKCIDQYNKSNRKVKKLS